MCTRVEPWKPLRGPTSAISRLIRTCELTLRESIVRECSAQIQSANKPSDRAVGWSLSIQLQLRALRPRKLLPSGCLALAADLCLIRSPYRKAAKPHHAFATPFGCREADFLATKYCFPSLHVRQMRSGCHWYFASSSSRRGLMSLMANFLATTRITRRRDPASGGKMPEKHLPGIWDLSVIKTNAVRAASALKDVGKLSRCAYQVAGVTMKDTASRGSPSLANSGTIITLLTRWP